jgi:hypothetical protein
MHGQFDRMDFVANPLLIPHLSKKSQSKNPLQPPALLKIFFVQYKALGNFL